MSETLKKGAGMEAEVISPITAKIIRLTLTYGLLVEY